MSCDILLDNILPNVFVSGIRGRKGEEGGGRGRDPES